MIVKKRITEIIFIILFFLNSVYSANPQEEKLQNENKNDTLSIETERELFIREHSTKTVYIVFAGPYPASPTSSFGHIFLLLEPKNERPFLLWDTIDFSANSNNIGSIEYFIKGIFGGLFGQYRVIPFYEKYREYTFIESRPLWLFPLDLDEKVIDNLILSVFNLQNNSYQYLFSNKNCASQIDNLLNTAMNDTSVVKNMFFFPHTLLKKWKKLNNRPLFIESMHNIINENLEKTNIDLTNNTCKVNELSDSETAILLNTLEWKYFRENNHLNVHEKSQLDSLRMRISASNSNSGYSSFRKYHKSFIIHPTTFIGVGFQITKENKPEYLFSYRFGLHEYFENSSVYPQTDFLSLLKLEFGIKENEIRINEFLIFNQISLNPISKLSNYLSWELGVGMKRNYEYPNTPLSTGIFTGLGYTLPLLNDNLQLSMLMNLSPLYIENIGFSIVYGHEIISILKITEQIKWINIVRGSFKTINIPYNCFLIESNVSVGISEMSLLQLQFNYSNGNIWSSIKLKYYVN